MHPDVKGYLERNKGYLEDPAQRVIVRLGMLSFTYYVGTSRNPRVRCLKNHQSTYKNTKGKTKKENPKTSHEIMINRFCDIRNELGDRSPIIVIVPWQFPKGMCTYLGVAVEAKLNELTTTIHTMSKLIDGNFVSTLCHDKDISSHIELFFRHVLLRIRAPGVKPRDLIFCLVLSILTQFTNKILVRKYLS